MNTMSTLISFQKFTHEAEANEMAGILAEHGIPTAVEKDQEVLDKNFVGTQYDIYYQLKIPAADFDRARQLLIDAAKIDLADVPGDYKLLSFTREELLDVIAKPDEWGAYNYNIAQALLQQKGETVQAGEIEAIRTAHNEALTRRRELTTTWYAAGYGISVMVIATMVLGLAEMYYLLFRFYFLPGTLGIILGLYIRFTKMTFPDGTRAYSFSDSARRHGLFMIVLGIVALLPMFYPFVHMIQDIFN